MAGNPTLPKENIDEVILGLLALEPNEVDELSYEQYNSYLRELLVEITSGRKKIDSGETELIKNEFKRVRGKKGRFRIASKSSKVTANGLGIGGIRKQLKGAQSRLMLAPAGGNLKTKVDTLNKPDSEFDVLSRISNTLDSIVKTLTDINKENKKKIDRERKDAEGKRRAGKEKEFESKTFDGIKNVVKGILKPFESIWDRIIKFITMVLLGRALIKLLDWFADPKNQGKIRSVIRFFTDHWPTLLALYLRFGTGIGRFVGRLGGILVKGAFRLGAFAARLATRAGLKKFAGAARFLGGPRGRAIATGIGIAADVAVTAGTAAGIGGLASGDIKVPGFSGGGWNKGFGNLFGNMFSGLVKGPKGRDKVPAMLTDGEFVMSAGAVQKYGVDTFESMNAAGGGTNVPQIASGVTFAEGGGYMGDYMSGQVKLRPATISEMTGESSTLRNLLGVRTKEEAARIVSSAGNKVPDVKDLLGNKEFSRFEQGQFNKFSEGADEKTFKGLRRIYQQHFGVGEEFSKMMSNRVDAEMLRRSSKPTSTPRPKPKVTRIDPSRMLPAAGESSANAMRAAAKNLRPPIPATSAIVPYTGGGLAKTGVTAGLSAPQIPQIRTNMRVPGGFGNLKSFGVELLLNYLIQSGLDYVEAKRLASTIEKARKESPEKLANRIEKLRELVDKEERFQKSFGGILQKVIKLGGETGSEVLSRQAKTILAGVGAKTFQGGAIKGGYKLKDQSFKDAPKTQIMTDDKGRPFVGYKAMRGGKLVYVRGPQPGTGTSNPFEMLGRAINPGAYKDIDAENARKKYDEAARGSIASLKARGATQATIAKRQAELNRRKPVNPPVKPKPKVVVAGGGMNGRRGSGSKPSTSRPPSFSASTKGMRSKIETLGMMR